MYIDNFGGIDMNQNKKEELEKLHNEHATIWRGLELLRTDVLVIEKDGNIDVDAEKKQQKLEEQLKEKEREIQEFLANKQ